jgi:hypothetical protein
MLFFTNAAELGRDPGGVGLRYGTFLHSASHSASNLTPVDNKSKCHSTSKDPIAVNPPTSAPSFWNSQHFTGAGELRRCGDISDFRDT